MTEFKEHQLTFSSYFSLPLGKYVSLLSIKRTLTSPRSPGSRLIFFGCGENTSESYLLNVHCNCVEPPENCLNLTINNLRECCRGLLMHCSCYWEKEKRLGRQSLPHITKEELVNSSMYWCKKIKRKDKTSTIYL